MSNLGVGGGGNNERRQLTAVGAIVSIFKIPALPQCVERRSQLVVGRGVIAAVLVNQRVRYFQEEPAVDSHFEIFCSVLQGGPADLEFLLFGLPLMLRVFLKLFGSKEGEACLAPLLVNDLFRKPDLGMLADGVERPVCHRMNPSEGHPSIVELPEGYVTVLLELLRRDLLLSFPFLPSIGWRVGVSLPVAKFPFWVWQVIGFQVYRA